LLDRAGGTAYPGRMIRFFDLADRDRLPQRFAAAARSVLARG
jgi:hypothetical protein